MAQTRKANPSSRTSHSKPRTGSARKPARRTSASKKRRRTVRAPASPMMTRMKKKAARLLEVFTLK